MKPPGITDFRVWAENPESDYFEDEWGEAAMEEIDLITELQEMIADFEHAQFAWKAEMLKEAVRYIAQLEEERRWVTVNERLPEPKDLDNDFWCLVLSEDTDIFMCRFIDRKWDDTYFNATITAWMPLPQPPKAATGGKTKPNMHQVKN